MTKPDPKTVEAVAESSALAEIAEALTAHRFTQAGTINGEPAPGWCSCGERWFNTREAHDAHVAEVLTARPERVDVGG